MSRESPDTQEVEVESNPRPLIKCDRAADLFTELGDSVRALNTRTRLLAPTRIVQTSPAVIEVYRPEGLTELIPTAQWDALFHDGVHNLRAALDGMTYDFAHFELQPTNPGQISFPITGNQAEWPHHAKKLSTVPRSLLERIRECQPWARPDPQEPDPLALLSRIDNHDKHRTIGVHIDVAPLPDWADALELPDSLPSNEGWTSEPWGKWTLDNYSGRAQWSALVRVHVVPIGIFREWEVNLLETARWLHSEVRRVIQFLASGHWPDGDYIRTDPGPVWNAANPR